MPPSKFWKREKLKNFYTHMKNKFIHASPLVEGGYARASELQEFGRYESCLIRDGMLQNSVLRSSIPSYV
jgi:hypothetical protein